jgi:hypothetical protein
MKLNLEDSFLLNPNLQGLIAVADTQTLLGAGAVNVVQPHTNIIASGAIALTLANGQEGQLKFITCSQATGNATLTPANLRSGVATTIVFSVAGGSCLLMFVVGRWNIIGISPGAAAA